MAKISTMTVAVCSALTLSVGSVDMAQAQTQTAKPATSQDRSAGRAINDGWITMKVHSQFINEDALEDSDIDVDTVNGVVTLSGTVASAAGRTRALAIAKATDGVKSVSDKLKVAPATDAAGTAGRAATGAAKSAEGTANKTGRRVNDGWIKSKVYSQFLTEDALNDSDIDIDVAKGVVTLNGTVKTEAGRARALAIAKATEGVTSVKDSLRIAK